MGPPENTSAGYALRMVGSSLVGFARECNEDAVGCFDGRLAVVVDAMGGHASGSLVPPVILPVLRERLRGATTLDDQRPTELLAEAFTRVHEALRATAAVVGLPMTGAGAVVGALWISGDRGAFAHVGDTRCYRWRDGELRQIGREHSLVQELLQSPEALTEEIRANMEQYKHIVTRAFFAEQAPEPELVALDLRVGDRFLLCSDGLWRAFEEAPPDDLFAAGGALDETLRSLLERGLARPSGDNLSAVLAEVCEAGRERPAETRSVSSLDEGARPASELRPLRWSPERRGVEEVSACLEGHAEVADAWEALASRGIIPLRWTDAPARRFLGAVCNEDVPRDEVEGLVRALLAQGAVVRNVADLRGGLQAVQWIEAAPLPPTLDALALVACDVEGVERAERLVDEAAARLRPFGYVSPPRHLWLIADAKARRDGRWPLDVYRDAFASLCDVREFQRDRWPGTLATLADGSPDYVGQLCEADDAWSAETSFAVPRWHATLRGHPYADLASPFRPLREIVALGYQALDVGLSGRVLMASAPEAPVVEGPSPKPEAPAQPRRPWWRFW